ncbi:MAG: hypothetical protein QM702_20870 [Rubrivivax sp.]
MTNQTSSGDRISDSMLRERDVRRMDERMHRGAFQHLGGPMRVDRVATPAPAHGLPERAGLRRVRRDVDLGDAKRRRHEAIVRRLARWIPIPKG